jgi:AmiR/NasT family two-component response regulator
MATHSIGDDEAFEVLRQASTSLNRRLADIARDLVEQHNSLAGGTGG